MDIKAEESPVPDPRCAAEARPGLHLALFRRFHRPLMVFFRRRTGDMAEAEDLAQEALLRVMQRGDVGLFDPPDAFVFATARNLLRDRARRAAVRERSRADIGTLDDGAGDADPEHVLQLRQDLQRALVALADLGDKTRDMFILHRLEDMKHREIAALYGISVSAVEKHLIKAFAHLMNAMEEE